MDTDAIFLNHHLFRHRCPDTLSLGEYSLQMIDRAQACQIQLHLTRCPHCRRELVGFQRGVEVVPQVESLFERMRVWFARREQPLGGMPAYALRGESDALQIFSAENGTQVAIDIQPQENGFPNIVGVIIGAERAIIDLWHAGELQTQTAADELGNFQIDNLKPGNYELIVASETFLLHIQKLTI